MTECNCCGDCCEAIGLTWSQAFVRERADIFEERFRRWVVEELRPITSRRRLRELLPGVTRVEVDNPGLVDTRHWFTCTNFDRENRLCRAHDTRPDTCAGFPWYGGNPRYDALRLYPRCSFHADVEALQLHIDRGLD
jgi:Fe-S-cluster containining protein